MNRKQRNKIKLTNKLILRNYGKRIGCFSKSPREILLQYPQFSLNEFKRLEEKALKIARLYVNSISPKNNTFKVEKIENTICQHDTDFISDLITLRCEILIK